MTIPPEPITISLSSGTPHSDWRRKPAQLIENPGYRFGAAAISEKNELFVYWCFQIAKGSNNDPDDNAAELAAAVDLFAFSVVFADRPPRSIAYLSGIQ